MDVVAATLRLCAINKKVNGGPIRRRLGRRWINPGTPASVGGDCVRV